jgi:S1-C subfamily serine protease
VKAQFKILSGSRAGQVEVHSRAEIIVGRHPSCDFRFDPEKDLDVSARHASIHRSATGWFVKDLQSRNGTLVNGHRINGDTKLSETDQIRLGADGPTLEFRAVTDSVADTPPAVFAAGAALRPSSAAPSSRPASHSAQAPASSVPDGVARSGSTTQRIKLEVARETRKLRRMSVALVVVLILLGSGFFAYTNTQQRQREAETTAMRARVDSILNASDEAVKALQGQVAGLADALKQSQTQVQQLQTQLATAQASGDRNQVAELSRRLSEASDMLRNQQLAAQVDYRGINASNAHSIAIIYVEFGPGDVYTGTAFAVKKEGFLLTNRHVVAGEDGSRKPTRVALKFADSYQIFKASVVKLSTDADLALVKVENLLDNVPVVHGINARSETVQAGDPVALIGFPLGVELPMGVQAGKEVAKTTFGAGTVSKVLPDRVQIDGYSAQGASGSPIFDRNGDVVAVLYGGQEGTNGRVLYAVPASFIPRLLSSN